jgi:CRISPR-associated protein Csm2
MGDWKTQLDKHPSNKGGGGGKKCATPGCEKILKDDKFTYCWDCNAKHKAGDGGHGGIPPIVATLPKGYLAGGYFETKNGKQYIREEVFITWVKEMSAALKAEGLTPAAIRRFFSKLRAIEYKFRTTKDFDLAREGIYAFSRDVAYTENRGVTKPLFSKFIELNCTEAKKDAEHFRAFVEHFQSVVAYFKEK